MKALARGCVRIQKETADPSDPLRSVEKHIHEGSAEPQIPRLPRIFLSRVAASVDCMWFSLGEPHKWSAVRAVSRKSGYARDDKGKGVGSIESGSWTEAFLAETTLHRNGCPLLCHPESPVTFLIPHKNGYCRRRGGVKGKRVSATPTTTLSLGNGPLSFNNPLLCHPERSRGICSSADPSWICFSTERSGLERSAAFGAPGTSKSPTARI
jgi:hypothetical protein